MARWTGDRFRLAWICEDVVDRACLRIVAGLVVPDFVLANACGMEVVAGEDQEHRVRGGGRGKVLTMMMTLNVVEEPDGPILPVEIIWKRQISRVGNGEKRRHKVELRSESMRDTRRNAFGPAEQTENTVTTLKGGKLTAARVGTKRARPEYGVRRL